MRQGSLPQRTATVLGVLALAAPAFVSAQDQGIKQVEQLIKKAGATVSSIGETKVQLAKTMDVYNSLLADGAADRKGLYKKLQKEMENTEKKRADIKVKASEMDAEAQALFQSWADSAAAIDSPELRKRTEERLQETKARYAEIGSVGAKATELYGPVMKTLADQVTYLGHDLNESSVASLRPDAKKLNAQADELAKRIDDTITTTNDSIGALRP